MQITLHDLWQIAGFIFGLGILYQKVSAMDKRVERMEKYFDSQIERVAVNERNSH